MVVSVLCHHGKTIRNIHSVSMKLVHVIPHVSQEASGPSYSVSMLCQKLASLGHDVELSCLAAREEIAGVKLDVHRQWELFPRFAVSHTHALALRKKSRHTDIVHNHSLWSMVNVATGWVVPGKGAKLVTSPRGTLSEWALSHSKQKKLLMWPLQKRALERADLLHATSDDEYVDIRKLGLNSPVLVAPNGIDLPDLPIRQSDSAARSLLFLSRIHPTKGIETLLDAWARIEEKHSDWTLHIAGPGDERYLNELRNRSTQNGSSRVNFVGPLYGTEKSAAYRNADLFVLPSHSENFGMVVAEALAHECPAIVSHGAPWSGLESAGCGWWIPNDPESLHNTLDQAMCFPRKHLHAMGVKGRVWMKQDFSWHTIAQKMEAGYRWLVDGGAPPACIRLK